MGSTTGETVLLTLGRLPVALDIARSFRAAGWRVIVAEPFRMHLARMSRAVSRSYRVSAPARDPRRYRDDIRRIVNLEDVRLIVPVSEESIHVAALVNSLPRETGIFCAPQTDMLSLHDKLSFSRLARDFGLEVPLTAATGSPESLRIAALHDFVLKPRHSSSGRGVTLHRRGEEPRPGAGMVVQEFLAGEPVSSFAIVRDGKVIVNIVYRGVVMSGSVAVCFERLDAAAGVEDWVRVFAERSAHTGFLAFDFILDDCGRTAAIECNPRATSGIHFLAAEVAAAAILGRGDRPVDSLRPSRLLTESYSCYTACLASLFRRNGFLGKFAVLHRARDITWRKQDPWPFLAMLVNTSPLIWRAIRRRQSFAEVAALDIEWLGDAGD